MADLATLGFAVDSSPLVKGATALDQLATSAGKADTAVDAFNAAAAPLTKALQATATAVESLNAQLATIGKAGREAAAATTATTSAINQVGQASSKSATATAAVASSLVQATAGHKAHTAALNDNVRATKLSYVESEILTSSFHNFFDTVLAGGSPMKAFVQQATQASAAIGEDGLGGLAKRASGSFSGLVAGATAGLGAFGATAAAIGGVATAAGAAAIAYARFASNQHDVALGLAGSGRASGATVSGINRVADANSSISGGLSAQSIREMSTDFAKTGKIGTEMYGDLSRFAKDYAVISGTDVTEATQAVAEAFASQSQGALKLNQTIGGLSGASFELIRNLEAQGDRLGAQKATLAAFSDATKAAAENVGLLSRGWASFKAGLSNAADDVGKIVATTLDGGSDLQERLATAQKQLESAKSRSAYVPFGLGEFDVSRSQERVDELTKAIERESAATKKAADDAKTLAGVKALDGLIPGRADLLQLETFRSTLQQALDTGKATSGTEDALKRVNELLKAGGTEAYNLGVAAKNAFANATLLPFQAQLATIKQRYDELLKTASEASKPGLIADRELEIGGARVAAINNPVRDAKIQLNEQIAGLRVQRDSFLASASAAGEMAAKQDLINQYTRAGVTITPSLTKAIDDYSKKAGEVAAANENLKRTQDNIVQGMDELRSGTQSGLTGLFSAARQGQDVGKALLGSLGKMADQGFDRLISKPLTESALGFMGKGGGGLFGDTISKAFGDVKSITTPMATVTASVVNVNGTGVGGIGIGGDSGLKLPSGGTAPIPGVASSGIPDVTNGFSGAASVFKSFAPAGATRDGIPLSTITAGDLTGKVSSQYADRFQNLINDLQERGYNIKSLGEGGYSYRTVAGSSNLSNHSFGEALDINPRSNPWGKSGDAVKTDFPPDISEMAANRGLTWGGNWNRPDAMHFQVNKGWKGSDASDSLSQNSNALSKSADDATKSVSSLSDKVGELPSATDSFTDSLNNLGNKLASAGGGSGGGFGFGSLFGGGGGDSLGSAGLGETWSANGNVMTSKGPMRLNRYAMGGVATSPQVSIFGEGRGPEAYVPLPDGRSIPVSMKAPMAANGNGGGDTSVHAPLTVQQTFVGGTNTAEMAAIAQKASAQAVAAHQQHLERNLPGMLTKSQKKFA